MFTATRITNGIISVLALFVGLMLFFGGDLAMRPASLGLALVAVFFLGDVILRKKESVNDIIFSALWTLLFALALFEGMMLFSVMYTEPMYAEPLGGLVFVSLMITLIYGVPLLLNSIYLVRLLKQRKIQAE